MCTLLYAFDPCHSACWNPLDAPWAAPLVGREDFGVRISGLTVPGRERAARKKEEEVVQVHLR